MRPELTLADARDLPHEDLIERVETILAEYDAPQVEPQVQKLERITRILDEMPQVYRWFWQLQSFCDHWTQASDDMFGRKDRRYQALRQRRDLFEHMASAAKQRYEAASRLITVMEGFDPTGMPNVRRGS